MNNREQLKDRLAELVAENRELQENLANVRRTGQQIEVNAVQNVGAQKEIQRMLQELGEEDAGDNEAPAEEKTKPEAKAPKEVAKPG